MLAAAVALLLCCGDARMQPLYFLITTAGTDTHSICYETHQKAKDILEGRKIDPAGNIKADKEKSTEKIDGAIATIMALDRAIRCGNDNGQSVYDERGLIFL